MFCTFERHLYHLFLLSIFFPYITLVDFGSDVQPYSLLFGIILLPFLFNGQLHIYSMYLLAVLVVASGLLVIDFEAFGFRAYYGYLSFFLIFTLGYLSFEKYGLPTKKFVFFVFYVWTLAGLCQMFIDPNMFHSFLPRVMGYGGIQGRGVESLSAEPTFYGFLILIWLILYPLYKEQSKVKNWFFLSLLIFQLIFISRSSSAIGTLFIGLFAWLIVNSSLKGKFLFIISMLAFSSLMYFSFERLSQLRLFSLVEKVYINPREAITADLSMNDRLFHIYYSIYGFFENFMIPHGFSAWWEYISIKAYYNPLALNVSGDHGRVMSFIGGILFEIGIFSLPILFVIFSTINRLFYNTEYKLPAHIVFFVLLLQSIPLSLPTLPFLLGLSLAFVESDSTREHANKSPEQ